MSISRLLALYGFSVVVFLALDYFWLTRMVPRFYKPLLGHLLAAEPRLLVAGLFYLVYVVGILYVAVWPGLQSGSVLQAVVRGALFGFFTYATYDLTNQATGPLAAGGNAGGSGVGRRGGGRHGIPHRPLRPPERMRQSWPAA